MPELAFFRHGEELLRVALGESTRIGRAPECDVSLPDPAISRLQAVIQRRGERHVLLDRSGRGTTVNGADVPEAELLDGTELALGTWRALYRAASAAEEDATRVSHQTAVQDAGERGGRQVVPRTVHPMDQDAFGFAIQAVFVGLVHVHTPAAGEA